MKQIPKVENVMTRLPQTIGKKIRLDMATELMREHRVRHLPVQHEGKLVGVLSDRDIKVAASFRGPGDLTVEDVMTSDPYAVTPDTPIDQVAEEMAEHKYGCAIVCQPANRVIGIFTANDCLKVLSQVLRGRLE